MTPADTSILLRLPNLIDPRRAVTDAALSILKGRGEPVVVARQNFVEFRGVATRPIDVNGLGMSLELDDVYKVWRRLCRSAGVAGKQVHDTRLVAVRVCADVQTILTWNPKDFARFMPYVPGLVVLIPEDI